MPILWLLLSLLCALPAAAWAEGVPNGSFERGVGSPERWTVAQGAGAWEKGGHTGQRCISLTGDGKESQFWKCENWLPEPGKAYRLTFWARSPGASGGCIISNLNAVNEDFPLPQGEWQRYTRVFVAPRTLAGAFLRLGCWNTTGKVLFDDVTVSPVVPLHGETSPHPRPLSRDGRGELGEGERITKGVYRFQAPLDADGSNYARPLSEFSAGYNTNRWVMTDGSTLLYRHRVPGARQRAGAVMPTIGYYQAGRLVVEASKDGQAWQPAGELGEKRSARIELPAALFPADEVWVRLRGEGEGKTGKDSHPGSFQIHGYTYEATLEGSPADAAGRTTYLEVTRDQGPARVAVQSLGGLRPDLDPAAHLRLANPGTAPLRATAVLTFAREGGKPAVFRGQVSVPAGGEAPLDIPYSLTGTGAFQASLTVAAAGKECFAATTEFSVPALFAADFGYLVAKDARATVWWSEPTYKVSRERPAPTVRQPEVRISAARHEYEPFQVVLRPAQALSGVTVAVEDLVGPGKARIAAANAKVCLVHYVNVQRATDRTGTPGAWPDALPPYEAPFDVPAGANQPLWITLYVPRDTAPGDYAGRVRLRAGAWAQDVPVRLHVWNFALPKETHLTTAFGFDTGALRRYHNLETAEEHAKVVDLYLRNFAAHRISPYNPTPFAPIKVSWGASRWSGGRQITENPREGKRCLQVVDDNPKGSVGANTSERIAIEPEKEYTFSWAARAEKAGQVYQVTLQHYDAAGQWLSGRNFDARFTAGTEWKRESVSLKGRMPAQARAATITLRPAPWSEAGEAVGTVCFDALSLRAAPDGPELAPDGGFEMVVDPSQVKVDFTAFDRAAEVAFDELGFNSFRLSIEGMGGGTFHSRHLGSIAGHKQGTPEYEVLFTAYARQLQDHLEAKGWLNKAYIYWFDEPEERDYDFVKEGMALLKRAAPKLARMLTEQVEPALAGSVDIWCPVSSAYSAEPAQARQKAGERVWWYVCTGPKEPYCTLFIDHPGIEMRTWLWQTVKYGVEGILVWTSNYWTSGAAFPAPALQNPWDDAMSYVSGYDYQPGQVAYWGNGDGRFLYPPNRDPANDKRKHLSGPVDSIRWEMLREGIEDYEYFRLLRQALQDARSRKAPGVAAAEKLLHVPAEVTSDMTHFALEAEPMYRHRERLGRAIEGLAR